MAYRHTAIILLLGIFLSCAKTPQQDQQPVDENALQPLAILKAGANPIWFELGDDGPNLINSPAEAGLVPFTPWPLARHIRAVLAEGDELVFGVNREGFLRTGPWDSDGIALYRIADVPYWAQYSLASLFFIEEKPAALLYRDDFFSDSPAPLPGIRTWSLANSPAPAALEIPAFDDLPAAEGWDVDALRQGPDGFWYYRGVNKNSGESAPPQIVYFRTADLGQKGEAVSISAFQNSVLPEPVSAAPDPLRSMLKAAFDPAEAGSAQVVSPDFSAPRRFSGGGENSGSLSGYYRSDETGSAACTVLIFPDGRGLSRVENSEIIHFSLPPLPEGFVYTGLGLSGVTLFAAWEEQQGYAIGAAGFMVIKPFP
ncbi:MAG: hypothetical protein LBN21_05705 [Treponema sp.]|jgi:hypothetical protein|nr:hypothetical protein [Treponema sp.]